MRFALILALCLLAAAPAWAKRALTDCDFSVDQLTQNNKHRFERAEVERDRIYTLMSKYDAIFTKLKNDQVHGLSKEETRLVLQGLNNNWTTLQDDYNKADSALANAKEDLSTSLDLTEAQHKAQCQGQ